MKMQGVFGQLDNVTKTLYVMNRDFKVSLRVNLSDKNMQGNRLNADYISEYNSRRFSDRATNKSYYLNTSDFLVLAFFRRNPDQTFQSEDIFLSYPHLPVFKAQLSNWINSVTTDKDGIWQVVDVNGGQSLDLGPQADDYTITFDKVAGDSVFIMRPAIFVDREGYIEEGVEVFFNNEQNSTIISLDSIIVFYHSILKNFDLNQAALTLTSVAATNELYNLILSGSNQAVQGNVQTSNNPQQPTIRGLRKSPNAQQGGFGGGPKLPPRSRSNNNFTSTSQVKQNPFNQPSPGPNLGGIKKDPPKAMVKKDPFEDNTESVDDTIKAVDDMFSGKDTPEVDPLPFDGGDTNVTDDDLPDFPEQKDEEVTEEPKGNTPVSNLLASSMDMINKRAKEIESDLDVDKLVEEGDKTEVSKDDILGLD